MFGTSLLFRGKSQVSKQVSTIHARLHAHIHGTSGGFSCILVAAETRPCSSQALLGDFRALTPPQAQDGPPPVQAEAERAGTPLSRDRASLLPHHRLSPRTTPVLSTAHGGCLSLPAGRQSYEKASREKGACLETTGSWREPALIPGGTRTPGWRRRQDVRAPRERKGVHAEGETQAAACRVCPRTFSLRECSRPVLAIGLFTLSVCSCSGDSTFLRTSPFPPASPFYWHRAACSSLF